MPLTKNKLISFQDTINRQTVNCPRLLVTIKKLKMYVCDLNFNNLLKIHFPQNHECNYNNETKELHKKWKNNKLY